MSQYHADYTNFQVSISREEALKQLIESYEALCDGQNNWVSNLSNLSSLLWHCYKSLQLNINWAGFYVLDNNTINKNEQQLILGPFQGKVACQLIPFGKGVCGTCASTLKTQVVKNVHEFPGHIACDGKTKSEIVVPIINQVANKCIGVIDIDCLDYDGFSQEIDGKYLEILARKIVETCKF
ncbi:probable Free methionine-R-sulfoxide reductase [Saccharomycodes ludwigii]|uniref:Probable Free methionine-R-sulfoxide reductase n=1 Tax=Saccharomycodes ludwigii TaxID=36035 RepID=A0A376B7K7_9ASCO|nr:probable Free methionine-R-sulfoxide reductase [Saccharomycodes ludwigii]